MKFLTKRNRMKTAAAAIAVCIVTVGGAGSAYAANIGGIQRTVQIWLHGDQTAATLEVKEDGTYELQYSDAEGETKKQWGGGVTIEPDGTQHPVSEDEIMEQLNAPDVEYTDDGQVWIYYHKQKLDITDKFNDEGVCYVKLEEGGKTLYVTVKYQNGYSCSGKKYPEPSTFN